MAESELTTRRGGEGGHGAAKPDRVIHRYVFYHHREEQFLMSSRDTRSAAGSAVDSAAEPAASQSPAPVPPPTLLGEAPTSQKRKASQLSTSS
jgi:hypothetical protein